MTIELVIMILLVVYAVCITVWAIAKNQTAKIVQLTLEQTAGRYNEAERLRKKTAEDKNNEGARLDAKLNDERELRKDAEKETEKLLRDIRTANTIKDLRKRYKVQS
jgi:pyruvate/2-oxoacid:ferredoxin oxidoreductase beta subunit